MIGIYKITSPTGRIYIGQSVDIERRFKTYFSKKCKEQIRLHSSFLKHGVKNHVFEIIEACCIEDINLRERYWQEFYSVLSKKGLNCRLTGCDDKSGVLSDSVKVKIGINSGKARKGSKLSESHKLKIALGGMGRVRSKASNEKLSNSRKGIVFSELHIQNLKTSHGKKVIDLYTGIEYYSARFAAESLGLNWNTLMSRLNGNCINNTTLRYV